MRCIDRTVLLGAAVLASAITTSATAAAEPRTDPLLTTSWIGLGTGAGATAIGAVLLGTQEAEVACGKVAGCVEKSTEGSRRDGAAISIGGGLGLAAVGALGAGLILSNPLAPDERRDGPAAATAGLVLTSLAGASLGAGFALGALGTEEPQPERGGPLLVAGGLLLAAGVPLLVAGSAPEDEAERRRERADDLAEERAAPSSVGASLAPRSVSVGPGSVSATWAL